MKPCNCLTAQKCAKTDMQVGGVDVIAAAKEGSVALLSLVIRFTPEKINQVDEVMCEA